MNSLFSFKFLQWPLLKKYVSNKEIYGCSDGAKFSFFYYMCSFTILDSVSVSSYIYTLSKCPGGYPILHGGLKWNSKNSAGKYKKG